MVGVHGTLLDDKDVFPVAGFPVASKLRAGVLPSGSQRVRAENQCEDECESEDEGIPGKRNGLRRGPSAQSTRPGRLRNRKRSLLL